MADVASVFAAQRYAVCRGFLSDPDLSFFDAYARKRAASGTMHLDDIQVPGTPSKGADPMMDSLLVDALPQIEALSGLAVFPTYSFFRVYKRGDILKKHKDRASCEISVTLCLGYEASKPWPIWIDGPNGTVPVDLEPGDAMLYRGVECVHWRDPFEGDAAAQVFLHYVDQQGPYADWKYDKGRAPVSIWSRVAKTT